MLQRAVGTTIELILWESANVEMTVAMTAHLIMPTAKTYRYIVSYDIVRFVWK